MSRKDEGVQGQMDQIKRLQDQINNLQIEARDQLVDQANQAIQDLNQMGFDYRLVQGGGRGRSAGKITRHSDPNRPCPVCRFRTVPFHDARTHRSQGSSKKAFTADELRELGLKRA